MRKDSVRRGLIYLGTENGLYVSFNDGEKWQPLQSNLPHAPVAWMTIRKTFNDLVVATYGRGFYILDDLGPLQQLTAANATLDSHLFAPRPAYRFRQTTPIREVSDDPTAGKNPSFGAALSYWLKSATDVSLTVADATGKTVRKMAGTKVQGVNRVYWDLRFDPSAAASPTPAPAAMPTPPSGPEEGPPAEPGPPLARRNAPPPSVRQLAPPDNYTVTLRAGGKDFSPTLEVIKDPNSGGSLHEIELQTAILRELAADLNTAAALTAGIENVRRQIEALLKNSKDADLRTTAGALNEKFVELAEKLQQQKQVAFYEWPVELTAKFVYLVNHVQSSDRQPTDQAREAQAYLQSELQRVKAEYDSLTQKDLTDFNTRLERLGLAIILTTRH